MQDHNLLTGNQWQPLLPYGFKNTFWTVNSDTLVSTFVVTCIIILGSLCAFYFLNKKESLVKFIILQYIQSFKELLEQSLQSAPLNHLAFVASLFTFIFFCNIISCVPLLEEPTKDLNTTLAFSLISFFYVQGNAIAYKGIRQYLFDFTQPLFLMLPLNILGTLTSIMSLAFRLFGNIFGGYVICNLYYGVLKSWIFFQIFGLVSGINLGIFMVFGFFEGMIQAFVFAMLTLTYLSMEILPEEPE